MSRRPDRRRGRVANNYLAVTFKGDINGAGIPAKVAELMAGKGETGDNDAGVKREIDDDGV